jgi:hypothetical protein
MRLVSLQKRLKGTWEAEAGRSQVQGQPELHKENLSQQKEGRKEERKERREGGN